MSQTVALDVAPRTLTGKKVGRLRREGLTPAIVYGRHIEPLAIQVETRALTRALSQAGTTQLIRLKVAGEKGTRAVLVRDLQQHVTRFSPLHADFVEVALDELTTAAVPVEVTGLPRLVQIGEAALNHNLNEVTVEALPGDIPPVIEFDASHITDPHESIHVADLVVPAGVRILTDPATLVLSFSVVRRGDADESGAPAEGEAANEAE